jgi:hypothetical protein
MEDPQRVGWDLDVNGVTALEVDARADPGVEELIAEPQVIVD